jgi:HPt (histidine-containing phosphotransfer) domain-containing protein
MALPRGQSESRGSHSNAAEVSEEDSPVEIRHTLEEDASADSTPVDATATPVLVNSHTGLYSVSQAELEEMLQDTPGVRQQSEKRSLAEITASSPSAADGRIRSSLPMDDPEFCEIVCGFVQKLRSEVATMDEALRNGDIKSVARLAHWLKGSAGTMGFEEFTEPGTRLMTLARQGRIERIEPVLRQIVEMTAAVDVPNLELSAELA